MKTTINHTINHNRETKKLETKHAYIEHGKSTIMVEKIHHAVETVTVKIWLTKYFLTKHQGNEEKAVTAILEALTAKDLKRLLFDELDAQSVQPTTLKFKTLVYKVYTQKKKETK